MGEAASAASANPQFSQLKVTGKEPYYSAPLLKLKCACIDWNLGKKLDSPHYRNLNKF